MIRHKSEFASLGLDADGTVRGRLLSELLNDDAQRWPKYRRFGIFAEGFEWQVIRATSNTIVIDDTSSAATRYLGLSDLILPGDTINLTRVIASEPFTSTPFTVTAATIALNVGSGRYETTITVVEAVSDLADDNGNFLNLATIRPMFWQTYAIASHTTGASGDVVINDPADVLTGEDPWSCADLFLCEDLVQIAGSQAAINDGLYECRADFEVNGDGITITVKLDGWLNAIAPGDALGTLTFLPPPPKRVVATGKAVLPWYYPVLYAGSIVHCRAIDTRHRWFEILQSEQGPSYEPEPDLP